MIEETMVIFNPAAIVYTETIMNESSTNTTPTSLLCPVCHQPIQSEFYFCPNCGKSLKEKPLSTSISARIILYTLSIVTPMLCFLTISSWRGWKYFKSSDPRAKQIGVIAIILITLSTIVTVWLVYSFTIQLTQTLTGGLLGGYENSL